MSLPDSLRKGLFALFFFLTGVVMYAQQPLSVIPRPSSYEVKKGAFILTEKVKLSADNLPRLQSYVLATLTNDLDLTLAPGTGREKQDLIGFALDPKLTGLGKEGYQLDITARGIQLRALTETGLFYGFQTLRQLALNANSTAEGRSLPFVHIEDQPRFGWRAFMLDESRYFKGMDQVKKLLDEMARLKMNVFHWHLVDDQGWRIEIKKYPLLTEIGSKRVSTQIGPLQWKSPIQSGEVHEGFYTQDEIKAIVAYAAERHITIVPEIEMPGHSSAAIAAYSWLGASGQEIQVPIWFGVGKDVYNVANPRTYTFLTDVLDEVMTLFPSQVIHIGGDEVKYDFWKNSAEIQAYMQENNLASPADLQIFFTNTISQYLASKGRRMMGWNEIMGHNLHEYQDEDDTKAGQSLASSTVVHFWKGDIKLAEAAATSGYDIVNSLHSSTYIDYNYQQISLSKAYAFDPIPEGLDTRYHHKIIGSGCQMWGEWIPFDGQMDFQVFPRIAAYAEVGWTPAAQKDYDAFLNSLAPLLGVWNKAGIYYAPLEFANPAPSK